MAVGKKILKSYAFQQSASFLVSMVMRAVYKLNRINYDYPAEALPYLSGELPAIFCFWHGRMIMHPFVKPPGRDMSVLISHHNDGALITATMLWFGIGSVRGSKKLGAKKALFDLLRVTEAGGNISITPDGPRGPFQIAAQGAAFVAAKTGYPILPVSFSATRHKRLGSWDKFMMPLPFGRITFTAGVPIHASSDAEDAVAAITQQLQTELAEVTAESDRLCGVLP